MVVVGAGGRSQARKRCCRGWGVAALGLPAGMGEKEAAGTGWWWFTGGGVMNRNDTAGCVRRSPLRGWVAVVQVAVLPGGRVRRWGG